MNIAPFHASIAEIGRERERVIEEFNAAKARVAAAGADVAAAQARLARLDRMASDLAAIVREAEAAAADLHTAPLPMDGLPASSNLATVGMMLGMAAGAVAEQRRNRERNEMILKVMATGERDWEVGALVTEMTARGFTQGLTQPHDAIRMALDRMVKKKHAVVKMGPGVYRLMSRMADPNRRPAEYQRSIGEIA
jgi:hypothetical protein